MAKKESKFQTRKMKKIIFSSIHAAVSAVSMYRQRTTELEATASLFVDLENVCNNYSPPSIVWSPIVWSASIVWSVF